jgi:hypothetical protein
MSFAWKDTSMRMVWGLAAGAILTCAGCTATGPCLDPDAPATYVQPPAASSSTAVIHGTLTGSEILGSLRRARIERIDGNYVANTSVMPPQLLLKPGQHIVDVVCEHQFHTGETYIFMSFQAEAGHHYAVQCQDKNFLINIGVNFWISDEASGAIVARANGWGPSHNPTYQLF